MYYAVTTESKAPADDTLYTTSIPTGTNAETYYVWCKVVGDENHRDSEPACVTVSISRVGSGGGSVDEVKRVVDMIKALPEPEAVAAKDEEAVTAASEAYGKLTDAQKADKRLTDEVVGKLADDVALLGVDKAISGLPVAVDVALSDKDAIGSARKAYDGLTDAQKAKVPAATLKKLEDAEEALAAASKGAAVTTITVNAKKATAKAVKAAAVKAGASADSVTTIVLGKKVKKIGKKAFKKFKAAKTLVVKTKKLKKAKVKKSLKGSKIKTVKVQVGKKKANKKFAKKYKKVFTKKVAGKKAKVKAK